MSEKFTPAFGMKNRHIQTLFSSFFRKNPRPHLEHERFTLSDTDFVDISWCKTNNSQANTPIVILFHGLTGSYKSPYIRGMMDTLSKNGFHTVLMHFRGCYQETNKLPRAYHSGDTGDAKEFIESLKQRYPQAPLYAVGYSLGGNMLLKLLGEMQSLSPFQAAVSISAPMQLDVCADVINKGFAKIYQNTLMKSLKQSLKIKYTLHDMQSLIHINKKEVNKLKTFWEYDAIYTAPIHGFKSAQDYYTRCSARQYLKNIQTKTLILHASDDPFMNDSILPTKHEVSDSIELEVSPHGGHVGFISGNIFSPNYWLEKRVLSYFQASQR